MTKKKDWQKKLDQLREIDITVVFQYSHLREKLLGLTYGALKVKLIGTPQVCDGCKRSKAKSREVRKKTYKIVSNTIEMVFVDTSGPFPESLIGDRYWISIVDD